MGKKTTYRVDKLHDGSRVLTNTDANGLKTITTIATNGTSTTTVPNGTNVPDQQTPDPRFGMQSPLQNVTVNTPGGLQSTVNQTRAITQMTGNSVTGLTDNVQVNGKTYTTQWDGNARMLTKTSAEGRKTFSFYDAKGRDVKDSTAGLAPTMYKYDKRGRKIQTSQGGRITAYAYDSLSRQAKVTDPYGHSTQFFYDAGDRLIKTILPDLSEVSFTYDRNGNMLSITPPSKPAHGFEYTAVDLEQKYIPPFAGDSVRVTAKSYNYDKEITRIARPDSLNMDFFYGRQGIFGWTAQMHFVRSRYNDVPL
jgi:YD repeat-containing protein